MVDTLNEEPEDAAEDIDVSKMLENVDTNEKAVTEESETEESETEESETAGLFKEPEKRKQRKIQKNLQQSLLRKMNRKKRMRLQSSQEV